MNILVLSMLLASTTSQLHGFEKAGGKSHKIDFEDEKSQFNNKKERHEFFKELEKTHLPLEKTGLPIAGDSKEIDEDFEELLKDGLNFEAEEQRARRFADENLSSDDDDLNEIELSAKTENKMDPRPAWPCRRRRWWGSCSTRRRRHQTSLRVAIRAAKRIGNKIFRRRSWRASLGK